MSDTTQTRIAFSYDSLHRRVRKRVYTKDQGQWRESSVQRFLYQGDHEIGSVDLSGKVQQFRILGQGFDTDQPVTLAVELDGKTRIAHHDVHGSLIGLADPQLKELVESYRYSAYGEAKLFDSQQQPLTSSANPWRFASKRYDDSLQLSFFGRRDYDPALGRWLSPDPAEYQDGPNLYAYVHNRPLKYHDAYGLWSVQETCDSIKSFFSFSSGKNASREAPSDTIDFPKPLACPESISFPEPNFPDSLSFPEPNFPDKLAAEDAQLEDSSYTNLKIGIGVAAGVTVGVTLCVLSRGRINPTLATAPILRYTCQGEQASLIVARSQFLRTLSRTPAKPPLVKPGPGVSGPLVPKGGVSKFSGLSPAGSKRSPLEYADFQKMRNAPATINGRQYTGHALDRMQDRGLMPSVIENTIKKGYTKPDPLLDRIQHYDPVNRVKAVLDIESGRVITVRPGGS